MITCAIQIGSSHILAVAAQKENPNGRFSVIQVESEPASDCVRHGCIVNVEQAAARIRNLMQRLGDVLHVRFASAYVGIGGISLHSLEQLPSVQIPDYDVLASEVTAPGRYQLVIGRSFLRQRAVEAVQQAGFEVAGVIAVPQATAGILTDHERKLGCVLIDMGAGTTTVSVYKDLALRYLAVIPLGGDSVTSDIASAGVSYEAAEHMKCDWSNVASEALTENSSPTTQFADRALPMPLNKLNGIALCRYEEIAANIQHQLELSGCRDQLQAGCILTGGVARQQGLASLLSRCLSLPLVQLRGCMQTALPGSEQQYDRTSILAMLARCTDDCQAPEPVVPEPVVPEEPETNEEDEQDPDSGKFRQSFRSFVKDLFSGQ